MPSFTFKFQLSTLMLFVCVVGCTTKSQIANNEIRLGSGKIVRILSLVDEKQHASAVGSVKLSCVSPVDPIKDSSGFGAIVDEATQLIEKRAENNGIRQIEIRIYGPTYSDGSIVKDVYVVQRQKNKDGLWVASRTP